MKTANRLLLFFSLIALSGCGAGSGDSSSSPPANAAPSASSTGSKYDAGPRAADEPADEALAKSGEQLFKDKGCSACHAFGAKLSGPDLPESRTTHCAVDGTADLHRGDGEGGSDSSLMATHMLRCRTKIKTDSSRGDRVPEAP
jgi:mono/diheme cytochrome c family protein